MSHAVGLALVALGTAVIVVATVGAALMPGGVFNRLHFVTPVTTVGTPLVAVGLCVQNGKPFTIAELLFIALLVLIAGFVLESATGRLAAQHRGIVSEESPE